MFKYFCTNCLQTFDTGKFDAHDSEIYDDVCPYCGALGKDFESTVEAYCILVEAYKELEGNYEAPAQRALGVVKCGHD